MASENPSPVVPLTLRVTQGLHEGAAITLQPDAMVLVGSDAACDVRLMDDGVAERHFALVLNGKVPQLRPFAGALSIDGRPAKKPRIDLQPPARLALGDHCQILIGDQNAPAPAPRSTAPGLIGLLSSVTVVAAIVTWLWPLGTAQTAAPTVHERRAAMEQQLAATEGAQGLTVAAHGQQLVVSGVIADELREAIASTLTSTLPPPTLNLVAQSELVAQVKAVFASNGFDADVVYDGDAAVRVSNLDGDNAQVRRVAEHVRRDVAGLRELTVTPAPAEQAPSLTIEQLGGNARLSRIVDGQTAYLASTDGGRYFVGSVLPSGHRIRQITRDAVQLDHEGRIDWVRF